jgi:signal transduction histidine kinase
MFLILVATVSFYWLRLDSGQARIRDDAITLRDYRLLSEAVGAWVLSGELIFGRQQPDLIEVGLQQGEQITVLASELSGESLSIPYVDDYAEIISIVERNQSLLTQLQQSDSLRLASSYSLWDASSQEVIRLVLLVGEQLLKDSEISSELAARERSFFFTLIGLECAIFGLLIFALWRWVTRLFVRPLGMLTADARQALQQGTRMQETRSSVDEIGMLSSSINDFTQSLSDRVDERTAQLRERQQQLTEEVELRKLAQARAQDAADRAIAASKAKGQFLANMSHEFRTPLNAVIGGSQLLGMMELKEAAREWAQTIEQSGTHLLALVDSALDLSRLNEGEFQLNVAPLPMSSLLDHCRSVFDETVKGKPITFAIAEDADFPEKVMGDQLRIQQILGNLIRNAVEFTEQGEIRVSVAAVSVTNERVQLHWTVSDTGEGIPADSVERIFESFEQVDNSDARRHGGSGLGLTVSRGLARLMGGDISVESVVGEGSTFRCFLLLDLASEQSAEHAQCAELCD